MNETVLLLGSNIGERDSYIEKACLKINELIGNIIQKSSVYQSKAHGYNSINDYLNQVIIVQTHLKPLELLSKIQSIENELGRVRSQTERYTDRTIDIDILFYNKEIIDCDVLTIPHPRIEERIFVLKPLAEIMPNFKHPTNGLNVSELLQKLE